MLGKKGSRKRAFLLQKNANKRGAKCRQNRRYCAGNTESAKILPLLIVDPMLANIKTRHLNLDTLKHGVNLSFP
jgi:hypothetical protein